MLLVNIFQFLSCQKRAVNYLSSETVSLCLPWALRAAKTLLPLAVAILSLKPCLFTLFLREGWYVLFIVRYLFLKCKGTIFFHTSNILKHFFATWTFFMPIFLGVRFFFVHLPFVSEREKRTKNNTGGFWSRTRAWTGDWTTFWNSKNRKSGWWTS